MVILQLQEVLAKMVQSAVQFDIESRTLKINSRLTMGKSENCELRIVLEALEVSSETFYTRIAIDYNVK